jgi:hypothetical protein
MRVSLFPRKSLDKIAELDIDGLFAARCRPWPSLEKDAYFPKQKQIVFRLGNERYIRIADIDFDPHARHPFGSRLGHDGLTSTFGCLALEGSSRVLPAVDVPSRVKQWLFRVLVEAFDEQSFPIAVLSERKLRPARIADQREVFVVVDLPNATTNVFRLATTARFFLEQLLQATGLAPGEPVFVRKL